MPSITAAWRVFAFLFDGRIGDQLMNANQTPQSNRTKHPVRGIELLPAPIRKQLPPLYAQDGKGGNTIAYLKLFTPDSSWTWYLTEGSPEGDDFIFFGLVEGHEKELGYVSLSELQSVRGPMGLPIERDLHFKPTKLRDIAPEMFRDNEEGR
jgi:hypothetical protein